jgi:hypothetical protein
MMRILNAALACLVLFGLGVVLGVAIEHRSVRTTVTPDADHWAADLPCGKRTYDAAGLAKYAVVWPQRADGYCHPEDDPTRGR